MTVTRNVYANPSPLADRIAQAIGDPGSILPRTDRTETLPRWATRAVLAAIGADAAPAGMDARPVLVFTVHCSHCGKPAPCYEDDDPCLWSPEDLARLGAFHLDERGWKVDTTGVDPEHEGRAVACPACWMAGSCNLCGGMIHEWQEYASSGDGIAWHDLCRRNTDEMTALTGILAAAGGDAALAALAELRRLYCEEPATAGKLAAMRAVLPAPVETPPPPVKRPWTPDRRNNDGSTTVTSKRCCNGCGRMIGDVSLIEINAGIAGQPLPDVRGECPNCCPVHADSTAEVTPQ